MTSARRARRSSFTQPAAPSRVQPRCRSPIRARTGSAKSVPSISECPSIAAADCSFRELFARVRDVRLLGERHHVASGIRRLPVEADPRPENSGSACSPRIEREALHHMHLSADCRPPIGINTPGVNPTVSTTRTSPSQLPIEWPPMVGWMFFGRCASCAPSGRNPCTRMSERGSRSSAESG